MPHEKFIYRMGGFTAFTDGPDDEALAAAHVACGEDAFDRSGVFSKFGFGIRPLILLDTEAFESDFFRLY